MRLVPLRVLLEQLLTLRRAEPVRLSLVGDRRAFLARPKLLAANRIVFHPQYNGTTNKTANIGTNSTCTSSDNTSVVDFGNLSALDLGYACWWYVGNDTVSSDMRLNSTEYSWAVNLNGCVAKYSVEDVATHELGHTFGLNDVSESPHPALTMSAIMLPCQNAETTLGLGDVKGMEALY